MKATIAAPVDPAIVADGGDVVAKPLEWAPPHTAAAPALDGRLDDPCWTNAAFRAFSDPDADPALAAEFAVVRDDWGLYVALRCREPDLGLLRMTSDRHDGLFEFFHADDWVEVLVDPGGTGHDYYWFLVNPAGRRSDLACFADPDRSWNGEWRAATGREPGAWTVEVFIPAATFNRAPIGSTWGFQVARMRINEGKPTAPQDEERTRTVWGGTYRRPGTWPKLTGMHVDRVQSASQALSVDALTLSSVDAPAEVRIGARITNQAPRELSLRPIFRLQRPEVALGFIPDGTGPLLDVPAGGLRLDAGVSTEVSGRAEAFDGETVVAHLALFDESGNLLHCTPDRGVRLPPRIDGPGPEFDLYTTEAEMRLRFQLPAHDVGLTLAYRLRLANGVERAWRRVDAATQVKACVSLADVPDDRHALVVELRAPDGVPVAHREFPFWKAAPGAAGEAKINRWRRCLWVDGKPYVAMGNSPMITHGLGYATNMMRELSAQGFNTVVLWGGYLKRDDRKQVLPEVDAQTLLACLDAAQVNNLKVILYLGALTQNNPASPFRKFDFTDDAFLDLITEVVLLARGHPALLGYESADEPEFFVAPEWLERVYGHIKERDPHHIVTINNCRGARSVLNFKRASDLVGLDYYPCGKWPAGTVGPLAGEVVAFADHRPVRMWIQGYKIFNPRAPTPDELSMMTWSMLARGASALFYFIGKPPVELWAAQGRCARDIRACVEAATAEKREPLAVNPANSGVYADFRETSEADWIIAVNEGDKGGVAELRLPAHAVGGKVVRVSEAGEVRVENGVLRDAFAPFQHRVYRIGRGP